MCIGMSKAGLSGTSTLNVVLMAKIFGAKESVGVILPMLIAADFMGYFINRKGGSWRRILPILPPAIAGVIVGWVLLGKFDNAMARIVIGWIIIALLVFNWLLQQTQAGFPRAHRAPGLHLGDGLSRGCCHHARECRRSGDDRLSPRPASGERRSTSASSAATSSS
jgi:uncharacterized membrane protein YfcA